MSTRASESFDKCLNFTSLLKGGRIEAHWISEGRFRAEGRVCDIRAGTCEPLVTPPSRTALTLKSFPQSSYFHGVFTATEVVSPDGRWLAGIQNYNLFFGDEQLTRDGESACSWDIDTPRMGMTAGGVFVTRFVNPWSPDSSKLFVTQFDKRHTGTITRTRLLEPVDEVETLRWTRAGEGLPSVVPYVLNIKDRSLVRVDVETKDRFLLSLGWSDESQKFYLVQFSRDVKSGTVYEVDASSGKSRALFGENGDTFIRIQHELFWGRSGCTLLPAARGFLWESERDGWKHLYHYDLQGQLIGRVTEGQWPSVDVLGFDERDRMVYFTAHHDQRRPYDVHLCRVRLAGGTVARLTQEEGVHDIQLAPDFSGYVDTVSRPDLPPRSTACDIHGKVAYRFDPMDISQLEAVGWTPPEEFSVKAADGHTDLWGILLKPRDFDPAKSYPVIEYIYGGPQVTWASHAFPTMGVGMWALTQALPQLGYVCVVLDARGTPERSKDFHDVVFKDWRRHVTADHAAAIRGLAKTRPWMDLQRVGMWGHSWGGYYTFACMLDAPDLYRAGVASAPGFDPYALFIYEPYLDGKPEAHNKEAYEDANLFKEVAQLKGELLILAGTDDVGVWHSASQMTNALIEAGKDHEFVMLPEQHHGFTPLHDRYCVEKIVRHFDKYVRDAL